MARLLSLAYGVFAYGAFLGVFLYFIAFVGGFGLVPKTLDAGPSTATWMAAAIDLGLVLLFGLQHSVMARQGFKRRWREIVPPHLERSTYVLAASLVLAVLMWGWRPISATIWSVEGPAATVMWAAFAAGWGVVFATTFLIDHFNLFGLRQVWLHFRGREYTHPSFQQPLFYQHVRHPLYLGFLLAFWSVPEMTAGHLLFAAATTGYILVAIPLEERDLLDFHGEAYARYRERVPMLFPVGTKAAGGRTEAEEPGAA